MTELSDEVKSYLKSYYYDLSKPGSYSGVKSFHDAIKKDGKYDVSQAEIEQFLSGEDAYTLYRPVKRHFKRPRIIATYLDQQWSADLIDFAKKRYVNDNRGYAYVLVSCDVLSKYAWLRPLKSKSGPDTAKGLASIFDTGRSPDYLQVDAGKEWFNKHVNRICDKYDIVMFTTHSETKSAQSENLIRTLRSKLFKLFQEQGTFNWIDNLDALAKGYNESYHSVIKMSPKDVTKQNEGQVWYNVYIANLSTKKSKRRIFKFKIGDTVRVTRQTDKFTRKYDENFSGEVFKIHKRHWTQGIAMYELVTYHANEPIEGRFYEYQLTEVRYDENQLFKIDEILKTRTRGGQKEGLIRWRSWPSKYDSWEKIGHLVNLDKYRQSKDIRLKNAGISKHDHLNKKS